MDVMISAHEYQFFPYPTTGQYRIVTPHSEIPAWMCGGSVWVNMGKPIGAWSVKSVKVEPVSKDDEYEWGLRAVGII